MNNRAIKFIIALISSVIAVIALFSVLRAGFAFWLYSHIGQWVTVRLGLDYYAAELLTVALTTAVMFAIPGFGSLIISRRKRLVSAGLVVGGYAVMCVLVYTVGRNVYFNRVTGEALRYFADTPQGREFSFTPGFDPRYGIPYKPYTQTVVQDEVKQQQLLEERRRKAEAEAQKQREMEEQKRLAEERRRQEEEQHRAEADARRQQEIEQQRVAAEARQREELEARRREAEAQRQYELQLRQLEAEQQAREAQQQQIEAEERRREREERERQDEGRRRREEESRRRKEETTRQVLGIIQEVGRKIRQRSN